MTVRINKQKINLREKLAGVEDKVNFDEVVRGLGEYTGNVGIGTTSPEHQLHIKNDSGVGDFKIEGTQPRIWLKETDQSDLNSLIRNNNSRFQIDTVADEDAVIANRFTILNTNGNVGIGTTNPSAVFHVEKESNITQASPHFKIRGNGYTGFHWLDGTAYYIGQDSIGRSVRIFSGGSAAGVELTNDATAWSAFSDERLKENITNLDSVIDKIKDIRCVTYTRSDVENSKETIGFIAQDFIGKFDQVINKSKISDEDEEEYYSIKYTETIPVLMKAIQEQQQLIEQLKSQNESQQSTIDSLVSRIENLENK